MIVGVISDTHGLLRPEALTALAGSDYIIHAGDIGAPEILPRLAKIAPVTAVRGNIDSDTWARSIPLDEVLEVGDVCIYVLHRRQDLDLNPKAAGFSVVVCGHSHVPKSEVVRGVLYFNPGSAGPRRFRLPVSVGKLTVRGKKVEADIITLAVKES